MKSLRVVKSVGFFAVLTFGALSFAAAAGAQPPIVRTKPVIDQQLQAQANKAKHHHGRAHHEHAQPKAEHPAPKK